MGNCRCVRAGVLCRLAGKGDRLLRQYLEVVLARQGQPSVHKAEDRSVYTAPEKFWVTSSGRCKSDIEEMPPALGDFAGQWDCHAAWGILK